MLSAAFDAQYAAAFARFLSCETERTPMITPVNEISYLAWAGGDVQCMNPFEAARGGFQSRPVARPADIGGGGGPGGGPPWAPPHT